MFWTAVSVVLWQQCMLGLEHGLMYTLRDDDAIT